MKFSSSMQSLPRLFFLCLILGPTCLHAQDRIQTPDLEVGPSPSSPQSPESPGDAAIEKAIESIHAELAELELQWQEEAVALNSKISETTAALSDLSAEELKLLSEFEALADQLFDTDERRVNAERELEQREIAYQSLLGELTRQAFDLKDRFQVSPFTLADPEFLAPIASIANPGDGVDRDPAREIDQLLGLYSRVLDGAETTSRFETDLRLTASGGDIREGTILRVGLLGGYYSTPLESGFVISPTSFGEKPEGRAVGLTTEQQGDIASLVGNPAGGGAIPVDVTGGAGLAALDVGDTIGEWFEKGGVFMWPIAIVAALALLMVIERALVLFSKTRGIDEKVRKTLELIENDRVEEAIQYATNTRGPVGGVLQAALIHHNRDRAVMEDAVQEALLHVQPQLTARLSFIALCAAVAPLMGLLGTVTGMILTFNQVTIFGTSDPRFMAGGISVALITTQGGLYLAIPCLLARGILGAFADRGLGKIETGAMSVVLTILEGRSSEEEQVTESEFLSSDDSSSGLAEFDRVDEPSAKLEEWDRENCSDSGAEDETTPRGEGKDDFEGTESSSNETYQRN